MRLVRLAVLLALLLGVGSAAAQESEYRLWFPVVGTGMPMPPPGDYPVGYTCEASDSQYRQDPNVWLVHMDCTTNGAYAESGPLMYATGVEAYRNGGIAVTWLWWDKTDED